MSDVLTDEELAELDDPSAPNLPMRMRGHQGSTKPVPVKAQRDRRAMLNKLMYSGFDRDTIYNAMAKKFGMGAHAVDNLMVEVRAAWDVEDAEDARHYRSMQIRRLNGHIPKAAAAGKWTAVANLEKVYASVAGTDQTEDDGPSDLDARYEEAVHDVLMAELVRDPKAVRIMIQRERMTVELAPDGTKPEVVHVSADE